MFIVYYTKRFKKCGEKYLLHDLNCILSSNYVYKLEMHIKIAIHCMFVIARLRLNDSFNTHF